MSFDLVGLEDTELINKFEQLSQERKALQAKGHLPEWYTTQAWQMFKKGYAVEGEDALLGRHTTIAKTLAKHMAKAGEDVTKWENIFFDLMWQGILSPASPVLSNVGTRRGQPVSCSGQVIGDSVHGFYDKLHEAAILSKNAFGTSGDFSSIRPRGTPISTGGVASGAVEVIEDFFTCASKITQGGTRRGSFGAYLDIEHPDWDEAVDKLRQNHNGKNFGWVIRDSFVDRLKANDSDAKRRFTKMLHTKLLTGKGYIFCVDKANRHRPQMYKDLGLMIKASNLCTEIMLFSDEDHTYSCILSSLNLVHWNLIKSSEAVFNATVFLDCVCEEFLETSLGIPGLERVRAFTQKGRAIGLGAMGFHTYLQSKGFTYEGWNAQGINLEMAKHIYDESLRASTWLANKLGEPEWCKGYGVRNTHRIAYAPTKSTALLMGGVSESWFPDPGMVFDAGSAAGELRRIPPVFYTLMKEKNMYSEETIQDIIHHLGSVQHVTWLNQDEKNVFRNAYEMNQDSLFYQAMARQPYTCQGQSLNFYVPEDGSEEAIANLMSKVLLHPDCLSQYYIYSRSGVVVSDECLACAA